MVGGRPDDGRRQGRGVGGLLSNGDEQQDQREHEQDEQQADPQHDLTGLAPFVVA